MTRILELLALLGEATAQGATVRSDLPDRLSLAGAPWATFPDWTRRLKALVGEALFDLELDGAAPSEQELLAMAAAGIEGYSQWNYSLNKRAFLKAVGLPGTDLFFLTVAGGERWLNRLDGFSDSVIAADVSRLRVWMGDLLQPGGGPCLQLLPGQAATPAPDWPPAQSPSDAQVRRYVRVLANDTLLRPRLFELTHPTGVSTLDAALRRHSFLAHASALVQDFYRPDRVVVRGYRNVEAPLLEAEETPAPALVEQLQQVVAWAYEERTDTRLKLLAERLSLDLTQGASLHRGLARHLDDAFQRAREQYRFIILDRKDAYYRELRELLRELQGQSKAYADKLRSMTNALLRDVLASILLFAFGLFSKADIERIPDLLQNRYLLLLLKGLAVYFLFSITFQLLNNWNDLRLSRRELSAWVTTTRNYLPKAEVEAKIDAALHDRRRNYWLAAAFIAFLYLLLALGCWNFAALFG